MFRRILYIILGAPTGAILSTIPLIIFDIENKALTAVALMCGIIIGGYVGVVLSNKVSESNKKINAIDKKKGVPYLAGAIVGMEFLALIIGYIIAWLLLLTQYSGDEIFNMLSEGSFLIFWILIFINILSSWMGVKYVIRKGFLKPEHRLNQITSQVFGFNFIIYFSAQNIVGGIIGATISTLTIYYFLNKHRKQNIQFPIQ